MEGVRLILGDALAVLPTLEAGSVDAVITDAPYGLDYTPDSRKKVINDRMRNFRRLLLRLPELFARTGARTLAFFCRWDIWREVHDRFERLWPPCGMFVWDKEDNGRGNLNHFGQHHELVYVSAPSDFVMRVKGMRPPNVFRCRRALLENHPCEKPVPLMAQLVEMLCPEGGTVLDPFMGSGTTGIACLNSGRRFFGIELSADYYATAQRRLADACGPLFAAPAAKE